MVERKPYCKPEITKINIDPSFTLMAASPPINPMPMMPMGGGSKGIDEPFQSPFDDKPFG